jgi:hypothetical protein
VTPAAGAFVIWAPLFAGSLIYSGLAATPRYRRDPTLRMVGGLTAAVFAGNSVWSVNAQLRDLGWTSLGLIAASAGAAASATIIAERAEPRTDGARLAGWTIAPLAGWLLVATFANAEAALNTRMERPGLREEEMRAMGLIAAASGCAAALAVATRGNLPFAGAAAWGLAGIAIKNSRERRKEVTAAAAIGLAAVTLATLFARKRSADRSWQAAEKLTPFVDAA